MSPQKQHFLVAKDSTTPQDLTNRLSRFENETKFRIFFIRC